MAEGIKYEILDKSSYPVSGAVQYNDDETTFATTGEVAHFACPEEFYYMENRCHDLCGHKNVDTIYNEKQHTISVCNVDCRTFNAAGDC